LNSATSLAIGLHPELGEAGGDDAEILKGKTISPWSPDSGGGVEELL